MRCVLLFPLAFLILVAWQAAPLPVLAQETADAPPAAADAAPPAAAPTTADAAPHLRLRHHINSIAATMPGC